MYLCTMKWLAVFFFLHVHHAHTLTNGKERPLEQTLYSSPCSIRIYNHLKEITEKRMKGVSTLVLLPYNIPNTE
jgi:hypothetical protein